MGKALEKFASSNAKRAVQALASKMDGQGYFEGVDKAMGGANRKAKSFMNTSGQNQTRASYIANRASAAKGKQRLSKGVAKSDLKAIANKSSSDAFGNPGLNKRINEKSDFANVKSKTMKSYPSQLNRS